MDGDNDIDLVCDLVWVMLLVIDMVAVALGEVVAVGLNEIVGVTEGE